MILLKNGLRIRNFEYFYFFVMVIYMAMATKDTQRMVGSISGNPIPFLIPIVLTLVLLKRNKIAFASKKLLSLLAIVSVWQVMVLFLKPSLREDLSYAFFLYYAIIIAFIHVRVYGKELFPIYEDIMVKMCWVALPLWALSNLYPAIGSFFRNFPEIGYGNSFLYIFSWMDPAGEQWTNGVMRNAGFSWEPGRFAIMVVLAIYCNLCSKGIKFKGNRNVIVLLITLATTFSTTGYSSALVLYSFFLLKKVDAKSVILLCFVLGPAIYAISQLDFMGEKIQEQANLRESRAQLEESFRWLNSAQSNVAEGEYKGSLLRFDAIFFNVNTNIVHDPILGYGLNPKHSAFYQNISTNYVLTDGIATLLAQYGLLLGMYLYLLLWKSSKTIANESQEKRRWALFTIMLLFAVSYRIFIVPVFMAFWLYDSFRKQPI